MDLWEVICNVWDELYSGCSAIDEIALNAVLEQVRRVKTPNSSPCPSPSPNPNPNPSPSPKPKPNPNQVRMGEAQMKKEEEEEEEGVGLIEAPTPGSPGAPGSAKGLCAAAGAAAGMKPPSAGAWGLAGQGVGASHRLSGGVAGAAASGPAAANRSELLEFCTNAAVLLSQHKHEATAQGVPIVREGEVEDIQ